MRQSRRTQPEVLDLNPIEQQTSGVAKIRSLLETILANRQCTLAFGASLDPVKDAIKTAGLRGEARLAAALLDLIEVGNYDEVDNDETYL